MRGSLPDEDQQSHQQSESSLGKEQKRQAIRKTECTVVFEITTMIAIQHIMVLVTEEL